MSTLQQIKKKVENRPTISRVRLSSGELQVFHKDKPVKFTVSINSDGTISVVESDEVGGGKIGGVEFEEGDVAGAAQYVSSV